MTNHSNGDEPANRRRMDEVLQGYGLDANEALRAVRSAGGTFENAFNVAVQYPAELARVIRTGDQATKDLIRHRG